ncbi:hypothetical protein [Demequina aurantiaca]|uniref:hypothetical protein n=1 Tax=Demequina aurantiaca TaxID=676200 RepID=UPI003D34FB05
MSSRAPRPGSVTFVVFLMWLFALGSIIGGVLILSNQDKVVVIGADPSTYAWASIIIGVFMALLAISLSLGSRLIRFLVILTMLVRIALDVYAWITIDNISVPQVAVSIIFALLVIGLLSTRRAAEFFRG